MSPRFFQEICFLWDICEKNQKKLAAISGTVSSRRDMKPTDHPWCVRDDMCNFFPDRNTIMYSEDVLSHEKRAMLAILFAQQNLLGTEHLKAVMDSVLTKEVLWDQHLETTDEQSGGE